jgi:hypothetical protein
MNKFYFSDGEDQFGPFSIDELKNKKITKDTLIWYEGLDDWKKANKIEELSMLFKSIPPPIKKAIVPPPRPLQHNYSPEKTKISNERIIAYVIGGIVCFFALVTIYQRNQTKTIQQVKAETLQAVEQNQQEKQFFAQKQKANTQDIINELYKVKEEVFSHQFRALGGVTDIQIKMNNPTRFKFTYIKVDVSHYKANGNFYKTDEIYFYNVEPYSTQIESAPDSDRGIRLNTNITAYESPDLPASLQRKN